MLAVGGDWRGWPIAFAREKGTKRGADSWRDRRNAVVSSLGSAATPSRRTRRDTSCSSLFRLFGVSNLALALHVAAASVHTYNVVSCAVLFALLSYVRFPCFVPSQFEVNRSTSEQNERKKSPPRDDCSVRLANKIR